MPACYFMTVMSIPVRRIATGLLLLLCTPLFALEPGDEAPAIVLPALNLPVEQSTAAPREVRLQDLRGQVVYVDFWASWCAPCLVSMPLLNELRNRLQASGLPFEVLAVNVDSEPQDGLDFLQEEPVDYLVVSDPAGATPASYQVEGMPTGYVVDTSGTIRLVHQGFRYNDITHIEATVRQLLTIP